MHVEEISGPQFCSIIKANAEVMGLFKSFKLEIDLLWSYLKTNLYVFYEVANSYEFVRPNS